jgi:hypothetical protein
MLDGISECEVQLDWSGFTASSLGKRYHGVILEKVGFYAKILFKGTQNGFEGHLWRPSGTPNPDPAVPREWGTDVPNNPTPTGRITKLFKTTQTSDRHLPE